MLRVTERGTGLRKTMGMLAELTSRRFQGKLMKALAKEALHQVDLTFSEQRDPYGVAWAALKGRTGPILKRSGRLARSFQTSNVNETGFDLESSVDYAVHHQYGTARIPQRMMLPIKQKGLGPIWGYAFRLIAERERDKLLK